jgi:hypothetical protein
VNNTGTRNDTHHNPTRLIGRVFFNPIQNTSSWKGSHLMSFTPAVPSFEYLFRAEVAVSKPLELGQTPLGQRRIINIAGGSVAGPLLSGTILPGGADWQIVRRDGTAVLEARYTIETNDGAQIYVTNFGYRHGPPEVMARVAAGEEVDPAQYYFRAAPLFETAAPQYAWLNTILAMTSGMRQKSTVVLDFYAVR